MTPDKVIDYLEDMRAELDRDKQPGRVKALDFSIFAIRTQNIVECPHCGAFQFGFVNDKKVEYCGACKWSLDEEED